VGFDFLFRCLEVQLDSFVEGLLTFNVVFMNLIYTALHLSFGGESFGGGIYLGGVEEAGDV